MEYAISVIWSALEITCVLLFNGSFLQPKKNGRICIYKVLTIWAFVCVYTNTTINQLAKQILTVAAYTVLSIVLYQGSLGVHSCLVIICYIFIAVIDTIAINGMCYLLGISYNTLVWRKLSYITLVTADKLFAVFSAWILNHIRKRGAIGKQRNKWVQLSAFFPVVSAAMLAIMFYTSPRDGDVSLGIVIFAAVLMVANIAMVYVISSIEKATEQEQDLRLLRQQISIQAENYGALKKNYSTQRKATHEFERHIQVIHDLLDQKEYDAAQDYVRQLQADRTLKVFCISSNNPIIDVVLNQKYQVAQENSINMQVKVNDLSSITIRTNELVVLLSNLLDNAVEACLKLEHNREIVCTILKEDGIYISIRNTSDPVTIIHGEIQTTKQDATEHGYGLPAVKYILNQMKAEYTFAYQNGWFQFVTEIPE